MIPTGLDALIEVNRRALFTKLDNVFRVEYSENLESSDLEDGDFITMDRKLPDKRSLIHAEELVNVLSEAARRDLRWLSDEEMRAVVYCKIRMPGSTQKRTIRFLTAYGIQLLLHACTIHSYELACEYFHTKPIPNLANEKRLMKLSEDYLIASAPIVSSVNCQNILFNSRGIFEWICGRRTRTVKLDTYNTLSEILWFIDSEPANKDAASFKLAEYRWLKRKAGGMC